MTDAAIGKVGAGLGNSGLSALLLGSPSGALAAVCVGLGIIGAFEIAASYLVLAWAAVSVARCTPAGMRPAAIALAAVLIAECAAGVACAVGALPGQAPLPFVSLAGWQSAVPFATASLMLVASS